MCINVIRLPKELTDKRLNLRYVTFQCLDYTIFFFVTRKKKEYLMFFPSFRQALNGHVLGDLMSLEFAIQPNKYCAH